MAGENLREKIGCLIFMIFFILVVLMVLKIQSGGEQNFYTVIGIMNAFFILLGPYLFFKSQYFIYLNAINFEDINTILCWIKISSIASALSACLTIMLGIQFPTRQFERGKKYGYFVFISMIIFGLGMFFMSISAAMLYKIIRLILEGENIIWEELDRLVFFLKIGFLLLLIGDIAVGVSVALYFNKAKENFYGVVVLILAVLSLAIFIVGFRWIRSSLSFEIIRGLQLIMIGFYLIILKYIFISLGRLGS